LMGSDAYYHKVRRVLIIILVLNLAVAASKAAYGLLTNSLSMTSDGLHSFFDSTSNIIGIIGIALASRPPDKEYPYGHAKFETFASVGVAALLFASCFQIVVASWSRFLSPVAPEITALSFIIMIATLVLNVGISTYEYRLGSKLGSTILTADSMHTRTDIYASIGVIMGFFAIRAGYPIADPIIALLITGLIVLTGVEIIKDSSRVLLDKARIDEEVIKGLAESVPGVCSCHRIRTRGQPGKIYVDLHVGVDSAISIDEAHKISVAVEEKIAKAMPGSEDVVVHLEPKDYCEVRQIGQGEQEVNVHGIESLGPDGEETKGHKSGKG
jgi:cation diffusion facilitator family transporter